MYSTQVGIIKFCFLSVTQGSVKETVHSGNKTNNIFSSNDTMLLNFVTVSSNSLDFL